ncbi:MAG: flagellar hook protein FlgE [Acidobacteriota bacterium]
MGGLPFFIGLSGLRANAQGLNVVGDNLANTNTLAYKVKNAFFLELQNAQSLDLRPGQGAVVGLQQIFSQGSIQPTQVATDLAISGLGFFVVGDGPASSFFTRAGNFRLDGEGVLVTDSGLKVLGFPVVNGVVDQTAPLQSFNLGLGRVLDPSATSLVRMNMNLGASAPVGEAFQTSVVVFDSLGESHVVSFNLTKTAASQWDYSMTVPAADVGGAGTDPPVVINNGSLTFDSFGQLSAPVGDVTGITISGLSNGANDIVFDFDLIGDGGESFVTQVDLPTATSQTFQDGNAAGSLTSLSIRSDGLIEGRSSAGFSTALGQIAMATFANDSGLARTNDNLFVDTTGSGQPSIGVAGSGGRGTIVGAALENSNVDIAEEFVKLITFQRAYQANSRMITTADEITQETIALKR